MIGDLVKANRSCRRFHEGHPVELKTMEELVDLARLSASGANLQPLKYILVCEPQFKILLVLAVGKPKEEIKIEAVGSDGSIRYWRDSEGVHHVPKRTLQEIIVASHTT